MLNVKRPAGMEAVRRQNQCQLKLVSMVNSTKIDCAVHLTLTSQHLILEAPQSHTYTVVGRGDRLFHNLVVPLVPTTTGGGLQGCKLVQPWFGPNRWEGILVPAQNSTFEPLHEFRITLSFPNGGALEFAQTFQRAVQQVMTARDLGVDQVLPAYQP